MFFCGGERASQQCSGFVLGFALRDTLAVLKEPFRMQEKKSNLVMCKVGALPTVFSVLPIIICDAYA